MTNPFRRRRVPEPPPRHEADIAVGSISRTPPSELHAWVLVTVDNSGYPKVTVRGCPHDHVQMLAVASVTMARAAAAHSHGSES